ncbi:MAG: hypothetical protein J6R77_05105 [Clostridia bacterium]|nr:hypothetical protein [Clostridia bacterium]
MKKLLVFLLIFLMLTPLSAAAEEAPYATMYDLYASWNGYPDYVCGVWTETGGMDHLMIGILKDAEAETHKQEILLQIADDSTVTFVDQTYSYKYLRRVQEEISDTYLKMRPVVIVGVGVYENRNCVGVDVLKSKREDAETKEVIAQLTERYGTAIAIEYTGEIVYDTGEVNVTDIGTPPYLLWAAAILLSVGLMVTWLIAKRRRQAVAKLTTGEGVTLTRREVERRVAASVINPPAALEDRVLSETEK